MKEKLIAYLDDGLYQVTFKNICAGFVVKNQEVIQIAPILIKKFSFWWTIAKKVS